MSEKYEHWLGKRGIVESRRGGWKIGEGVYNCGYDMMKELVFDKTSMHVFMLNVTKRMPDDAVVKFMSSLSICLSWPDPRIWCNTMGALAGTNRARISSGVSTSILSSDSKMFAAGDCVVSLASFIREARIKFNAGVSVDRIVEEELAKNAGKMKVPVIPGYARPLAKGDERVKSMFEITRDLGFDIGPHEKLALAISDYLKQHYNEVINIGGYSCACLSDMGYSPKEIMRLFTNIVERGVFACFLEEEENPPLSFMPFTCEDVLYEGVAKRKVP